MVKSLNGFELAYLHLVEVVATTDKFDYGKIRDVFDGLYLAHSDCDQSMVNHALAIGAADLA